MTARHVVLWMGGTIALLGCRPRLPPVGPDDVVVEASVAPSQAREAVLRAELALLMNDNEDALAQLEVAQQLDPTGEGTLWLAARLASAQAGEGVNDALNALIDAVPGHVEARLMRARRTRSLADLEALSLPDLSLPWLVTAHHLAVDMSADQAELDRALRLRAAIVTEVRRRSDAPPRQRLAVLADPVVGAPSAVLVDVVRLGPHAVPSDLSLARQAWESLGGTVVSPRWCPLRAEALVGAPVASTPRYPTVSVPPGWSLALEGDLAGARRALTESLLQSPPNPTRVELLWLLQGPAVVQEASP